MTTTPRPVFLRPVEYTYSGTAFTVGAVAFNSFSEGTYANVLSLWHSFGAAICNEGTYTVAISVSDAFKLQITPSGSSPTITWDDTSLRDIFGFTGASTALSDGVTTTATYTPEYVWDPGYERSDQDSFAQDLSSVSSGMTSADGTYSGNAATGNTVYHTSIAFPMILETNLVHSADGSNAYAKERCLETFLKGCLTVYPSVSTHVSPKGFWYYPNINDAISDCSLSATEPWNEATNIGVDFNYTDSPDKKVFCHTHPSALTALRVKASLPVSRHRYDYSFSFHTSAEPTEGWQYVDYTP